MLATFSPESKLKNRLRELNCPPTTFAQIAGLIGKTRLIEGLSGKAFEPADANRLLEILNEMRSLQSEFDCPIDWSQTDQIQSALVARRIRKLSDDME